MFEIKLCRTREYPPQLIEHWLQGIQSEHKAFRILWKNMEHSLHFFCSEDLSPVLDGSSSARAEISAPNGRFFVHQNSLLPIKRPSQFEDKLDRERIWPGNDLVKYLRNIPEAHLHIQFKPVSERLRRLAMEKARPTHYHASKFYDQWESLGWFTWSWRRFLGPAFRRLLRTQQKFARAGQEHISSSHEREEVKQALLDKLARPLFDVQISMSHPFPQFFKSFSQPHLGQLKLSRRQGSLILSAEELASLLTLPHPQQCAAHLNTESSAILPGPKNPLAFTEEDRKRHLYFLGKTGMGKSSTLLHFIQEDIKHTRCTVVLDPHGDLIDDTLRRIPHSMQNRIVLLDPSLTEFPFGLNPLESHEQAPLQSAMLLEIFFALSQGSWGPRLEYILRNALLTLIHCPNTTLLDIPRLLTQDPNAYLQHLKDPELLRFWHQEFLSQSKINRLEQVQSILNKVGPLLTHPILRNIFSQSRSQFSFEHALQSNQIVLIPLSKGKLGEDASRFLGMVMLAMLKTALLKRSSKTLSERSLCCTFIDEFQNFCTPTLLSLLSEARKYGLALTLAHQYLTQLPLEIQDAVLGNVGSQFIFRCAHQDALKLAPDLQVTEADLTQLPPFNAYVKALYNQELHPPFRFHSSAPSHNTNPPPKIRRIGRPRLSVEARVHKRYTVPKLTRQT